MQFNPYVFKNAYRGRYLGPASKKKQHKVNLRNVHQYESSIRTIKTSKQKHENDKENHEVGSTGTTGAGC